MSEADDIAKTLIDMLVDGFVTKQGRAPEPEEVEQLLSELTEERVSELMGASVVATSPAPPVEPCEGKTNTSSPDNDAMPSLSSATPAPAPASTTAPAPATSRSTTGGDVKNTTPSTVSQLGKRERECDDVAKKPAAKRLSTTPTVEVETKVE